MNHVSPVCRGAGRSRSVLGPVKSLLLHAYFIMYKLKTEVGLTSFILITPESNLGRHGLCGIIEKLHSAIQ